MLLVVDSKPNHYQGTDRLHDYTFSSTLAHRLSKPSYVSSIESCNVDKRFIRPLFWPTLGQTILNFIVTTKHF